jgi:hypothetical protein
VSQRAVSGFFGFATVVVVVVFVVIVIVVMTTSPHPLIHPVKTIEKHITNAPS